MTWDWSKEAWIDDARKIPDDVMSYIRKIAVYAIENKGMSPEQITKVFGISRPCIYRWLNIYRHDGIEGLETEDAPGAEPKITGKIDEWLEYVVDCRKGGTKQTMYDIVEGGVANDNVIDTVEDYENNVITAEQALGQLKYKAVNHQLCILNQEIVDNYLSFISSEQIEKED